LKYDATKPSVTANASSNGNEYLSDLWTNHDVLVTFHCVDETSKVKTMSDSVTIITEGNDQSVIGYCTDNAGNENTIDFKHINVDKTPPEAEIGYDIATFDTVVSGKDNLGLTTLMIRKTALIQFKYTISDQAGNTLAINTDKIKLGKQVALSIKSLQYGNNKPIVLDPNVFFTLAVTDKNNKIKQLDQYYSLKDDKKIFTNYLLSDNITKIYIKTPGASSYNKENKEGIILLQLFTENGKLNYRYFYD
jgi:hypothetical protein